MKAKEIGLRLLLTIILYAIFCIVIASIPGDQPWWVIFGGAIVIAIIANVVGKK